MTICNTGSLATSEYGTALGVIRALHEQGSLQGCIALETRPYNQGSRLTAYEMVVDQLPNATLICDSMAAAYLNAHSVDAVVVGADRICANGDVANKIGTYGLALLARHHRVPFYVAAPMTTIDLGALNGSYIEIEQRPPSEVIESSRAPADIQVWNPAFDVTPADYVAGIITEKGVIRPDRKGMLNVEKFVRKENGQGRTASSRSSSFDTDTDEEDIIGGTVERQSRRTMRAARRLSRLSLLVSENLDSTSATIATVTGRRGSTVPSNYHEQTVETLPIYLSNQVPLVMKEVLEADRASDLTCVEFGDGNLNLVFLVTNATNGKQVIVKQALPYVRCVGESWPMTFERAFFESEALKVQKQACPQHTPTVHYFSKSQGLIVMEYLAPPCQILRKGLISRVTFPTVAEDMGVFCAHTLFKTSGFALSAHELREAVEFWSQNRDMCQLTESVVFTEPYIPHPNNRWTSPHLDADKSAIETDVELKLKAAEWKGRFVTSASALVHGDLHSGSVMCAPEDDHRTYAIDPEFAFYGPMGFDTGAFIANLFLNYASQIEDGDYGEWVLHQVKAFWETFSSEFRTLWNDPATHTGFLYGRETVGDLDDGGGDSLLLAQHQSRFLLDLLAETLGFAGMKMLRRVVGIAHVEDLESIEDVVFKVQCERHALAVAKAFIKTSSSIATIDDAIEIARSEKAQRA
jgi:5-methylthioribose kinase